MKRLVKTCAKCGRKSEVDSYALTKVETGRVVFGFDLCKDCLRKVVSVLNLELDFGER